LTIAFRYYSGRPDATPGADDPAAFVASMNVAYAACLALMAIALAVSLMRGGTRIEAAAPDSSSPRGVS